MNKHFIFWGGVIVLSFMGCGGEGKYADVVAFFSDTANIYKYFFVTVEQANNADDFVKAINDFARGRDTIQSKMKSFDKYPELEGIAYEEVPSQLRRAKARFWQKIREYRNPDSAFTKKFQQFASDPKVIENTESLDLESVFLTLQMWFDFNFPSPI